MALLDQMIEQPAPHSFQEWCWQTMVASFPDEVGGLLWGDVLNYTGWLDTLPVQEKPCR